MSSKKRQAVWAIIQQATASGGIAAIPTPGGEVGKHAIVLSVNEIALCVRIASIYSEQSITKDEVKDILTDAGITIGTGGALAIGASTLGRGIVSEMLNFIPVVGGGIKAAIAGSLTLTVGATFLAIAEKRWGE